MSINGWIKKMCSLSIYLPTIKYYIDIEKKEILLFATTWMKLEDIRLSEISQIEKDKYCRVSLIYGTLKKMVELIETE